MRSYNTAPTGGEGYRAIMIDKRGIESILIPRHDTRRVVKGYQIIIDTVARYNSSNSNSSNNKLAQAATGLQYENNNTDKLVRAQQQQQQQTRTSNSTTRIQ